MSHPPGHPTATNATARIGRAFAVGMALNLAFVAVECVFGILSGSSALLADAAHNVGDVLGLGMAWGASVLARRTPSRRHTYGLRRATTLAALGNSLLLLTAVGAVAWDAVGRLRAPADVASHTMMWVAAVGVVVNGASALLFLRGGRSDMNLRGAFLHLVGDAAISAGVVAAGALLSVTGWRWLDPVASLLISVAIVYGTWGLFREALHLSLDGVPPGVDVLEVRTFLAGLPGVEGLHDLHVWAMSTTETALTVHLVMPWRDRPPTFLAGLEDELRRRFGIEHATVQLEPSGATPCARDAEGAL